jgi:hypothetical protein
MTLLRRKKLRNVASWVVLLAALAALYPIDRMLSDQIGSWWLWAVAPVFLLAATLREHYLPIRRHR